MNTTRKKLFLKVCNMKMILMNKYKKDIKRRIRGGSRGRGEMSKIRKKKKYRRRDEMRRRRKLW